MGAAKTAVKAQQKAELAGKMAEIDIILGQLAEQQPSLAELFKEQDEQARELIEGIQYKQQKATYVTTPAETPKGTNYLLYIGIFVVLFLMFGRKK